MFCWRREGVKVDNSEIYKRSEIQERNEIDARWNVVSRWMLHIVIERGTVIAIFMK